MSIARFGSAVDGGGTNGTSHTFALDVGSGSNRYSLAFAKIYGDITGLAATYAGVSATLLGTKALTDEAGSYAAAFGIANPTAGSNNWVITRTPTSTFILGSAIAYTGVSGVEGVVATGDTPSAGILTLSVTIVNTGCWLAGGFAGKFTGSTFQDTPAGGDGLFLDDNGFSGLMGVLGIYDSNGTVGAGSQGIAGYRGTGLDTFSGVAVALAPVPSARFILGTH